ncbi:hypothetical protein BDV27DRAFT_162636 [Aspergillus caelatus]|uniref:Uncharacterized protein n=1 Tax=Aspergillus caelatus TaxID=61420 RepID=A0A5N6ZP97_9EURO|nr:uncharacterized protein BDV27DRAFT_162636 [Aspergillus caelatus]KAE8359441.1 hypothetical protein BDV27DRAFT_162636 [Aspergillus caelatus]
MDTHQNSLVWSTRCNSQDLILFRTINILCILVPQQLPLTCLTASGGLLAAEASKAVLAWAKDESSDSIYHGNNPKVLAINLSSDYATEWDEVTDSDDKIELSNLHLRLPFWAQKTATAKEATLYSTPEPKATPSISSSPATVGSGLGEYSSYDFTKVPGLKKTWTIENLVSDEGKPQLAWLLIPFSAAA